MTKEIKKWWEDNAKTFQMEHKVPLDITYGPAMPNENKLKLIGNFKGKNVLEIGCGGAQCGISFAKKGAKVIGIDISEKQLTYAKKLADKNKVKIKLFQGDIVTLHQIKSNSQDIVFSSWALFYVSDLRKCFKEVYRVLKKKGLFVFSTHHPFWEILNKRSMKVEKCYFETGRSEEPHRKGRFVWYKHTISELINTLISANFIIERVEEPDPRKKDNNTSKEIVPKTYKRKAMKLVPRTIIFKAKKP
jgi:ubiquinone/menaquinone biosynthesis C-methylase UbiE